MKTKNKADAAPAQSGQHTTGPREAPTLNFIVVNRDGKLLAILDSESEAYWFIGNRLHAQGSVYFKTDLDYSTAPDLLETLKECVAAMKEWGYGKTGVCQEARAAIAKAERGIA